MKVNSFNYRNFKKLDRDIPENKKNEKIWDLNETDGFVERNINGFSYKILGGRHKFGTESNINDKILKYIHLLDKYLLILKNELVKMYINMNPNDEYYSGCVILAITPHTLQEIPPDTQFEGVNKPLHIVYAPNDKLKFDLDNKYRAGERLVMLHLREDNKIRPWKDVKRLFIHELSHTMCNHCTYRTAGNHKDDFKKYEKFLTTLSTSNKNLMDMEKIIVLELFSQY